MPQPTPVQGHYDQLLSNFSVAYTQTADKYIAPQMFGEFPVDYQDGIFMRFPKGYWFRDQVEKRPLGGLPVESGYEVDSASYHCDEYGIATSLDSRERANATPPYDPERAKVSWLTQQQLIHRDKVWAASYFTTGIWGTDYTGTTGTPGATQVLQWDQSGSNPIDDIERLKMAMALTTGFEPRTLALGRSAFRRLRSNSYIIGRYQYTRPDMMSEAELASILDLDRIVVLRSVYNSAVEKAPGATGLGVTSTTDNVTMNWVADPLSALLTYTDPNPGLMQPTAGLTFVWRRLPNAGTSTAPILRAPDIYGGAFHEKFASRMGYGFQVVAPDLGFFISNIVAS